MTNSDSSTASARRPRSVVRSRRTGAKLFSFTTRIAAIAILAAMATITASTTSAQAQTVTLEPVRSSPSDSNPSNRNRDISETVNSTTHFTAQLRGFTASSFPANSSRVRLYLRVSELADGAGTSTGFTSPEDSEGITDGNECAVATGNSPPDLCGVQANQFFLGHGVLDTPFVGLNTTNTVFRLDLLNSDFPASGSRDVTFSLITRAAAAPNQRLSMNLFQVDFRNASGIDRRGTAVHISGDATASSRIINYTVRSSTVPVNTGSLFRVTVDDAEATLVTSATSRAIADNTGVIEVSAGTSSGTLTIVPNDPRDIIRRVNAATGTFTGLSPTGGAGNNRTIRGTRTFAIGDIQADEVMRIRIRPGGDSDDSNERQYGITFMAPPAIPGMLASISLAGVSSDDLAVAGTSANYTGSGTIALDAGTGSGALVMDVTNDADTIVSIDGVSQAGDLSGTFSSRSSPGDFTIATLGDLTPGTNTLTITISPAGTSAGTGDRVYTIIVTVDPGSAAASIVAVGDTTLGVGEEGNFNVILQGFNATNLHTAQITLNFGTTAFAAVGGNARVQQNDDYTVTIPDTIDAVNIGPNDRSTNGDIFLIINDSSFTADGTAYIPFSFVARTAAPTRTITLKGRGSGALVQTFNSFGNAVERVTPSPNTLAYTVNAASSPTVTLAATTTAVEGTSPGEFTVTLANFAADAQVEIPYTVAAADFRRNINAMEGTDFDSDFGIGNTIGTTTHEDAANTFTVTVDGSGDAEFTVIVNTLSDLVVEGNENVVLSLTPFDSITPAGSPADMTITDDPTFSNRTVVRLTDPLRSAQRLTSAREETANLVVWVEHVGALATPATYQVRLISQSGGTNVAAGTTGVDVEIAAGEITVEALELDSRRNDPSMLLLTIPATVDTGEEVFRLEIVEATINYGTVRDADHYSGKIAFGALDVAIPLSNVATLTAMTVGGDSVGGLDGSTPTVTLTTEGDLEVIATAARVDASSVTWDVNSSGTATALGKAGATFTAPAVTLADGNTLNIVSTAEDTTTRATYNVVVSTGESNVSSLSALDVTNADGSNALIPLSPGFGSETTSYTANVLFPVDTITVAPTATDDGASYEITVGGDATLVSGGTNVAAVIELTENSTNNTITITVTAEDRTVSNPPYTLTVTRAAARTGSALTALDVTNVADSAAITLSPGFGSGTTYTANVASTINTIRVTPVADPGATYRIRASGDATLDSGGINAFADVTLAENSSNNIITITATSESGTDGTPYIITVTRARTLSTDATLTGIGLGGESLNTTFSEGTTSYTVAVDNSVESITVTPTVAAGATYAVTIPSGSDATLNGGGINAAAVIGLAVSANNVITIDVTAENRVNTGPQYTITVTRPGAVPAITGNAITYTAPARDGGDIRLLLNYSNHIAGSVTNNTPPVTHFIYVSSTGISGSGFDPTLPSNCGDGDIAANTVIPITDLIGRCPPDESGGFSARGAAGATITFRLRNSVGDSADAVMTFAAATPSVSSAEFVAYTATTGGTEIAETGPPLAIPVTEGATIYQRLTLNAPLGTGEEVSLFTAAPVAAVLLNANPDATIDDDLNLPLGSYNITATQRAGAIPVGAATDNIVEGPEYFQIGVGNVSYTHALLGLTPANGILTYRIEDATRTDATVTLSGTTVDEGDTLTATVTLTPGIMLASAATFVLERVDATDGSPTQADDGDVSFVTVTVPAGVPGASGNATVSITAGDGEDPGESFKVGVDLAASTYADGRSLSGQIDPVPSADVAITNTDVETVQSSADLLSLRVGTSDLSTIYPLSTGWGNDVAFAADTTRYGVTIPHGTNSVTIEATHAAANAATATIGIVATGLDVTSAVSTTCAAATGTNTCTITGIGTGETAVATIRVTAGDRTQKEYTLSIGAAYARLIVGTATGGTATIAQNTTDTDAFTLRLRNYKGTNSTGYTNIRIDSSETALDISPALPAFAAASTTPVREITSTNFVITIPGGTAGITAESSFIVESTSTTNNFRLLIPGSRMAADAGNNAYPNSEDVVFSVMAKETAAVGTTNFAFRAVAARSADLGSSGGTALMKAHALPNDTPTGNPVSIAVTVPEEVDNADLAILTVNTESVGDLTADPAAYGVTLATGTTATIVATTVGAAPRATIAIAVEGLDTTDDITDPACATTAAGATLNCTISGIGPRETAMATITVTAFDGTEKIYTVAIGPVYARIVGGGTINRGGTTNFTIQIRNYADLPTGGYADIHIDTDDDDFGIAAPLSTAGFDEVTTFRQTTGTDDFMMSLIPGNPGPDPVVPTTTGRNRPFFDREGGEGSHNGTSNFRILMPELLLAANVGNTNAVNSEDVVVTLTANTDADLASTEFDFGANATALLYITARRADYGGSSGNDIPNANVDTTPVTVAVVSPTPDYTGITQDPLTYVINSRPLAPTMLRAAAGGTGRVTYALALTPALPAGLTFTADPPTISGTPTALLDETTFTLTATDRNGAGDSDSIEFNITVNAAQTGGPTLDDMIVAVVTAGDDDPKLQTLAPTFASGATAFEVNLNPANILDNSGESGAAKISYNIDVVPNTGIGSVDQAAAAAAGRYALVCNETTRVAGNPSNSFLNRDTTDDVTAMRTLPAPGQSHNITVYVTAASRTPGEVDLSSGNADACMDADDNFVDQATALMTKYTFAINRDPAAANDSGLDSLSVAGVSVTDLLPADTTTGTTGSGSVTIGANAMTAEIVATAKGGTVTSISGGTGEAFSGEPAREVTTTLEGLEVGPNEVTIIVRASNGDLRTYSILVIVPAAGPQLSTLTLGISSRGVVSENLQTLMYEPGSGTEFNSGVYEYTSVLSDDIITSTSGVTYQIHAVDSAHYLLICRGTTAVTGGIGNATIPAGAASEIPFPGQSFDVNIYVVNNSQSRPLTTTAGCADTDNDAENTATTTKYTVTVSRANAGNDNAELQVLEVAGAGVSGFVAGGAPVAPYDVVLPFGADAGAINARAGNTGARIEATISGNGVTRTGGNDGGNEHCIGTDGNIDGCGVASVDPGDTAVLTIVVTPANGNASLNETYIVNITSAPAPTVTISTSGSRAIPDDGSRTFDITLRNIPEQIGGVALDNAFLVLSLSDNAGNPFVATITNDRTVLSSIASNGGVETDEWTIKPPTLAPGLVVQSDATGGTLFRNQFKFDTEGSADDSDFTLPDIAYTFTVTDVAATAASNFTINYNSAALVDVNDVLHQIGAEGDDPANRIGAPLSFAFAAPVFEQRRILDPREQDIFQTGTRTVTLTLPEFLHDGLADPSRAGAEWVRIEIESLGIDGGGPRLVDGATPATSIILDGFALTPMVSGAAQFDRVDDATTFNVDIPVTAPRTADRSLPDYVTFNVTPAIATGTLVLNAREADFRNAANNANVGETIPFGSVLGGVPGRTIRINAAGVRTGMLATLTVGGEPVRDLSVLGEDSASTGHGVVNITAGPRTRVPVALTLHAPANTTQVTGFTDNPGVPLTVMNGGSAAGNRDNIVLYGFTPGTNLIRIVVTASGTTRTYDIRVHVEAPSTPTTLVPVYEGGDRLAGEPGTSPADGSVTGSAIFVIPVGDGIESDEAVVSFSLDVDGTADYPDDYTITLTDEVLGSGTAAADVTSLPIFSARGGTFALPIKTAAAGADRELVFTITPRADAMDTEDAETVIISLTGVAYAASASADLTTPSAAATINILNDASPTVTADPPVVRLERSATRLLTDAAATELWTITVENPASTDPVMIGYEIIVDSSGSSDTSARAIVTDYAATVSGGTPTPLTGATGTITITPTAAGTDATATISIAPINLLADDTIALGITSVTGQSLDLADIVQPLAAGRTVEVLDEATVSLSLPTPATAVEGDPDGAAITLEVVWGNVSTAFPAVVSFTATQATPRVGTATDYAVDIVDGDGDLTSQNVNSLSGGSVTFDTGEVRRDVTIRVRALNDDDIDPLETVTITLTSVTFTGLPANDPLQTHLASALAIDMSRTVTLGNIDAGATLSLTNTVGAATAAEGGATGEFQVVVSAAVPNEAVAINLAIAGSDTATTYGAAPNDYTITVGGPSSSISNNLVNGASSFPLVVAATPDASGNATVTFTVTASDDVMPDETESFTVSFGTAGVTNASLTDFAASGSVTISLEDNDVEAPGFCGRSEAVKTAIRLAIRTADNTLSGEDPLCGDVLNSQLNDLTTVPLVVPNIAAGSAALKSGDFDGLRRLTSLTLAGDQGGELPNGVFTGLDALTTLDMTTHMDGLDTTGLANGVLDSVLDTLTDGNLSIKGHAAASIGFAAGSPTTAPIGEGTPLTIAITNPAPTDVTVTATISGTQGTQAGRVTGLAGFTNGATATGTGNAPYVITIPAGVTSVGFTANINADGVGAGDIGGTNVVTITLSDPTIPVQGTTAGLVAVGDLAAINPSANDVNLVLALPDITASLSPASIAIGEKGRVENRISLNLGGLHLAHGAVTVNFTINEPTSNEDLIPTLATGGEGSLEDPYEPDTHTGDDDYENGDYSLTVMHDSSETLISSAGSNTFILDANTSSAVFVFKAGDDDRKEGSETATLDITSVALATDASIMPNVSSAEATIEVTEVGTADVMQETSMIAHAVGQAQVGMATRLIRQRVSGSISAPRISPQINPQANAHDYPQAGPGMQLTLAENPQTIQDFFSQMALESSGGMDDGGNYAVWARGQYVSVSGDPDIAGMANFEYDGTIAGVGSGVERRYENSLVGVSLNYSTADIDSKSDVRAAANYKESMTILAPYGAWQPQDVDLTLWGTAGFGFGSADISSPDHTTGSPSVSMFFVQAGADHTASFAGNSSIVVGVSALTVNKTVDAYTIDVGPVPELKTDIFQARADATVYMPLTFGGSTVRPYFGLASVHDIGDVLASDRHAMEGRIGVSWLKGPWTVDVEGFNQFLREDEKAWGLFGEVSWVGTSDFDGLFDGLFMSMTGGHGTASSMSDVAETTNSVSEIDTTLSAADSEVAEWSFGTSTEYGFAAPVLHQDGRATPYFRTTHSADARLFESGMRLDVTNNIGLTLETNRHIPADDAPYSEHAAGLEARWEF